MPEVFESIRNKISRKTRVMTLQLQEIGYLDFNKNSHAVNNAVTLEAPVSWNSRSSAREAPGLTLHLSVGSGQNTDDRHRGLVSSESLTLVSSYPFIRNFRPTVQR
ncbi:hypothetical protein RRG08_014196 [Elysia crispata]|uniref:Uncharacterized protein n=1 Tax=Elysia crispata TaxID=231223 RepID=A0AAE1D8W7_9GAST|nr:hypothetical protein RRG08_014196 [Elysia crispata]